MPTHAARLVLAVALALLAAGSVEAQVSCSSYSYSCGGCASAPSYLQCGWCQDTQQCLQGGSTGPSYPATCSSTSQGWGYGYNACLSPAARCAQHTSCSTCAGDRTGGCGWCDSSQQCFHGTSSGPSAQSCWYNWYWQTSQCPATYDVCNSYSDCKSCSRAPNSYACGWCSATNKCAAGSQYGDLNGNCPISSWTYQSCSCSSIYSCSSCVASAGCLWCGDGHTSHTIGQGGGCFTAGSMTCQQKNVATTGSVCNAYPGSDPYADVGSVGKASAAQVSGMVLMSLSAILTVIGICLYSCVATFRPVLGKNNMRAAPGAGSAVASRDCTSHAARALPLALLFFTVALKSVAVGLDLWARFTDHHNGIPQTHHFGLLFVRNSALGQTYSRSYVSLCDDASGSGTKNDHQLCHMVTVGGVLALISVMLMLLCQLLLVIFALLSACDAANVTRHQWKSWRCAGLSLLFTLSALAQWLFGGYFALHHGQGDIRLGASWILLTVSLLFDFLVSLYYRGVIHASPDQRYGEVAHAVAVPQGVAPLISHASVTPAFVVYPNQPGGGGMAMQPPGVQFASGYPVAQAGYAPVYAPPPAVYMQPSANPQGFVAPVATNPAAYQPLAEQQ